MKAFFTQRNIYILLFALLYFNTALVSTIHAVSFFCLANMAILGVLLAVTFEIGQAATLFSILTSKKERSKAMPWILMGILTTVQVLGNVFSSYKYLISNSADQLKYFKEPIFIWMDLPDQQANVILTYIIGAILPICALALTSMLTNYLSDTKEENIESLNITNDKLINDSNTEEISNLEEINNLNINEKENIQETCTSDAHDDKTSDIINSIISDKLEDPDNVREEVLENKNNEIKFPFEELENKEKKESKFINI